VGFVHYNFAILPTSSVGEQQHIGERRCYKSLSRGMNVLLRPLGIVGVVGGGTLPSAVGDPGV
jgi:hypothetical protein